jgi:hypothetical protein
MRHTKIYLTRSIILFVVILMLSSCKITTTTTKEKAPEFYVGLTAIESSLKTLINFQSANIVGFEKKTNDVITTGIQIKIINGVNLPTEENEIKNLAKKIAIQIKYAVKNQNEFKSYEVSFVKRIGMVSTWKSWIFNSSELNELLTRTV